MLLCAEFGISRPTGWLVDQALCRGGVGGISRAQPASPHVAIARLRWAREERVIALRQRYPDWGARKLEVVLSREGVKLTRSTIHRILLRYDLVR